MQKTIDKEEERLTIDELKRRAKIPAKLAAILHPYYGGKIEVIPKCRVVGMQDFSIWYTPGVARSCRIIEEDMKQGSMNAAYEHTFKWNTVAVVSDGSRVLGLGNIGPEAGLPVMEGKALLFKYLGGVDAFPVCTNAHEPEEIIQFVKWLQPSFGGINLEDISQPKCFEILDRLRKDKEIKIPVWHDDQQGTAAITLAGLINALKIVGKKIDEVKITFIGAGAANIAIARLIVAAGAKMRNVIMVDSKGILHPNREDRDTLKTKYPQKWEFAVHGNGEGKVGGLSEAVEGADVLIAMSTPEPGTVSKEHVKSMASNPIVFCCANPLPEIWPWDAKEAGAAIVATGRCDFDNQINNSLGFPGIFRGALDVRATTITDEMVLAASHAIAEVAEMDGLRPNHIVPTMEQREVFINEAVAVGEAAIKQGVARIKPSRAELFEKASSMIMRSEQITKMLMREGFIPPPPKEVMEDLETISKPH